MRLAAPEARAYGRRHRRPSHARHSVQRPMFVTSAIRSYTVVAGAAIRTVIDAVVGRLIG